MKKMIRYMAIISLAAMMAVMLPAKVYALNPQEELVEASIIYTYGHEGEEMAYLMLKKATEDYFSAGKPLDPQLVQNLVNKGKFPNYVEELKALGYTSVDYSPVTSDSNDTTSEQESTPAPEPAAFTVEDMPETPMWAISEVNCRNGASTDYAKIGSLKADEKVIVNGIASTGWYRFILADGTEAYVSDKYLTDEDPDAAAEPEPEPEPEETVPAAEPEPEPESEQEPVAETPEPAVEEQEPVAEAPEPAAEDPGQTAEPPVIEDEAAGSWIPIAAGAAACLCVIGIAAAVLIKRKKN